ncbi:MAG: four helix bundle protein [Patescibacteria group bacterium]|nr:four helix bundle protein [Patescibacteria group bacterium]
MTNENKREFDLEERAAKFGESIIYFCKSSNSSGDRVTNSIISQLVGSATSIGANYCEANNASSKKDFRNKIFICKKEAQETKYWLRMISSAMIEKKNEARELWKEAQELAMIFQKITSTIDGRGK